MEQAQSQTELRGELEELTVDGFRSDAEETRCFRSDAEKVHCFVLLWHLDCYDRSPKCSVALDTLSELVDRVATAPQCSVRLVVCALLKRQSDDESDDDDATRARKRKEEVDEVARVLQEKGLTGRNLAVERGFMGVKRSTELKAKYEALRTVPHLLVWKADQLLYSGGAEHMCAVFDQHVACP